MTKAVNPEILNLLRLQSDEEEDGGEDSSDAAELISTAELKEEAKSLGITARTLNYYIQEGVIPQGLRVGRSAAYPRMVINLLRWISAMRRRDYSIGTIKKMKPLWIYIQQVHKSRRLDLNRVQRFASAVENAEDEALFGDVLSLLGRCPCCGGGDPCCIEIVIRRDGSIKKVDPERGIELHFALKLEHVNDEGDGGGEGDSEVEIDQPVVIRRSLYIGQPEVDPSDLIIFNAGSRPDPMGFVPTGFTYAKKPARGRRQRRTDPEALTFMASKFLRDIEKVAPDDEVPRIDDLTEALKRSLAEAKTKVRNEVTHALGAAPDEATVSSTTENQEEEVSDQEEKKGA